MDDPLPAILLLLALIGFYIAFRAVKAGGSRDRTSTGWTVVASVCPLAGVVTVAAAMGRPEVALGAALAAGVAAIGLVAGMVLMQRAPASPPVAETGTWPLLIPVSLSMLLVGLAGAITPVSVGALLLLAVFVLAAVRVPAIPGVQVPLVEGSETTTPVESLSGWMRAGFAGLGVLIAGLAGWAAVEGALQLSLRNNHAPAGLLAACVLGPACTMPFLGLTISRASDGHTYHALGLCVRYAIVCVVGLLPLAAVVFVVRSAVVGPLAYSMPFPATLWRVEAVLLLAFSVLLVPLSAGRIVPTRRDGVLLLLLYVAYLVVSAVGGARLI